MWVPGSHPAGAEPMKAQHWVLSAHVSRNNDTMMLCPAFSAITSFVLLDSISYHQTCLSVIPIHCLHSVEPKFHGSRDLCWYTGAFSYPSIVPNKYLFSKWRYHPVPELSLGWAETRWDFPLDICPRRAWVSALVSSLLTSSIAHISPCAHEDQVFIANLGKSHGYLVV